MKKFYTTMALLFGMIIFAQEGELDPTFGTGGIINFTSLLNPYNMVYQPDGKLLIFGEKSVGLNRFASIIRLDVNGALDPTFGTAGIAIYSYSIGYSSNLVLQPSGKILVSFGGYLYRLNSDGTEDTTFNNNNGFVNDVDFIKVLSNGSIIGTYSNSFPIYTKKFSAEGIEDTTFNGGINPNYNGGSGHSCVGINELDSGKIVISTDNTYYSRRYNANGTFDLDYIGGNPSGVRDAKSINNSLFITCRDGATGESNYSVFKYNLSGNLDTSYSSNGITETNFNSEPVNISYNLNVQPNNKIIVVGKTGSSLSNTSNSSIGIARFNTNGTLDTTFGTLGKTVTPSNSNPSFKTLSALSPFDNKLTVVSVTNLVLYTFSENFMVARYTTGENLANSNFEQSQTFSISPNPSNSILNIQNQETLKSINIIDLLGRKTNITNFENNKIDVTNLQNGIYFLEIATDNGLQIQKFIKN
jgi:uncharacterized delta-60 repeat protein